MLGTQENPEKPSPRPNHQEPLIWERQNQTHVPRGKAKPEAGMVGKMEDRWMSRLCPGEEARKLPGGGIFLLGLKG